MPFETFVFQRAQPTITLGRYGRIYLNAADLDQLGNPEFLDCHYDAAHRQFAVSAATCEGRQLCRHQDGHAAHINAAAMFRAWDLPLRPARPATLIDGYLTIEVPT